MIIFRKAHPATQAMSSASKPADLNEGDIRRNPGEPDAKQAEASSYNKPRIEWRGLTLAIENPAGSVRRGRNRHGVTWEVRMRFDYGEILGTMGVDGDPVDVIVGPNLDAPMVYVVHQRKVNRWDEYDEDKCCVGFDSQSDAEQAFLSNYNDPRFLGPITALPVDEFVAKVRATRDAPAMIKAVFLKAHVSAYTKKDGTAVAAHEDKRAKHSPEQMAKWAEEKRQREQAQIKARSEAEAENNAVRQRMSDRVGQSGASVDFTPEEVQSIRSYIMAGDRHGAQAEGRNATINAIQRRLESEGVKIEHVSESDGGKSKSLYVNVDGKTVRVSDHELPMTAQREHNRGRGLSGKWDREVVVLDWSGSDIGHYVGEILGREEMAKAEPLVLFVKAHVGPYLRGGKVVNLAGYQGRPARARAANGQLSLFAPPSVVMGPNRYKDKHPVHDTRDLFEEPQHTEPTRELIEEHERLVDVLNSPSHEDDKVEAKKQAAELKEYKEEATPSPAYTPVTNDDHPAPMPRSLLSAIPEDRRDEWKDLHRQQHELHHYELGQVREKMARTRSKRNKAQDALRSAESAVESLRGAPIRDPAREADAQKHVDKMHAEYAKVSRELDGLIGSHQNLYEKVAKLGRAKDKIYPGSGDMDRDFASMSTRSAADQAEHEKTMLKRYREHYKQVDAEAKSAIGNSGAFDPDHPDITKAQTAPVLFVRRP